MKGLLNVYVILVSCLKRETYSYFNLCVILNHYRHNLLPPYVII